MFRPRSAPGQARTGNSAPIDTNTPPQALLKLCPTRASQALSRCAALAISISVTSSMSAQAPAMIRNGTTWLHCAPDR